jgi:hypothetical protein
MADQASGYLQKKIDAARKADVQAKLGMLRASSCCPQNSGIVPTGIASSYSSYLYSSQNGCVSFQREKRGGSTLEYTKRIEDATNECFKKLNPNFDVNKPVILPPCTLPPNTVYNAGLPIPVPKFPCVLINNMMTGS